MSSNGSLPSLAPVVFPESWLELRTGGFASHPETFSLEGPVNGSAQQLFRDFVQRALSRRAHVLFLRVNSHGGSVQDGMQIIGEMRHFVEKGRVSDPPKGPRPNREGALIDYRGSRNYIVTYIPSNADSMAGVIAAHGTPGLRYIDPNATILVHSARLSSLRAGVTTPDSLSALSNELHYVNDELLSHLDRQTNQREGYWSDLTRKTLANQDTSLTAWGALKSGMADVAGRPELCVRVSVQETLSESVAVRAGEELAAPIPSLLLSGEGKLLEFTSRDKQLPEGTAVRSPVKDVLPTGPAIPLELAPLRLFSSATPGL